MTQTVVITGASAGIARAIARRYGQRQAQVPLLARGKAGLEAAAADVREHGGMPPAQCCDRRSARLWWHPGRAAPLPVTSP